MISAATYRLVYNLVVIIATFWIIGRYNNDRRIANPRYSYPRATLILAAALSLFIGFRPVSIEFVDMVSYAGRYDWITHSGLKYAWNTENRIFDNLLIYSSMNGYTKHTFFFVITAIYYMCTFLAVKRLFSGHTLAAYIVWLGSFSTFSYSVNGIKAGAAAAFFLLAIAYYDRKWLAVLLSLVSLGFHHSMIACIVAYIIVLFFNRPHAFSFFWLACLIIAFLNITFFQNLFARFLEDDSGSSYLLVTEGDKFGGKGGFRYDFVLYSAVPIIIGYITLFRKRLISKTYSIIYSFYVLTNSLWLLCMYASFTNRIAYLSWFVYPFVLIYPVLEMNWGRSRAKTFGLIAFFSLMFTLFMNYIYN